ncbi:MAG: hypothetical protein JW923_11435 [Spirochaetales bacterium]|nr:hypothetical protein [Spirochaetales bacterium]
MSRLARYIVVRLLTSPVCRGFPEVTLLYNTNAGHKKIAEWAVASWKRNLGITIGTKNIEWSAFLRVRQDSHDFSIVRAGWVGDYIDPNTFLDMFLSDSGLNDGLYDNPDYDRLVRGAAQLSGAARMDALRQAEDMLITRDQHVIPLYYYANQDLIDLTVWDGWYSNPLGIHPPKYLKRKK